MARAKIPMLTNDRDAKSTQLIDTVFSGDAGSEFDAKLGNDAAAPGLSPYPDDYLYTGRHGQSGPAFHDRIAAKFQSDLDLKAILLGLVETNPDQHKPRRRDQVRVDIAFAAIRGKPQKAGRKATDDEDLLDQIALKYFTDLIRSNGLAEIKLTKIISEIYPTWANINENQRRAIYVRIQKNLKASMDERIVRQIAHDGEFDHHGSQECRLVLDSLAKAGLITSTKAR